MSDRALAASEVQAAPRRRPLRVLVIAHNAVAPSNRRRVDYLALQPGIEVALLTPRRWYEEGRWIEVPEHPRSPYRWRVGGTLATGNGTRYVYTTTSFTS